MLLFVLLCVYFGWKLQKRRPVWLRSGKKKVAGGVREATTQQQSGKRAVNLQLTDQKVAVLSHYEFVFFFIGFGSNIKVDGSHVALQIGSHSSAEKCVICFIEEKLTFKTNVCQIYKKFPKLPRQYLK